MSEVFDLKTRLNEMGIQPKKAFGQNFLVSSHVIGKIIDCVTSRNFQDLVEVGPGLGALTERLMAGGLKPQLIELDPDLAEYWRGRGMKVHEADALKLNWAELQVRPSSLLVSNLPYQISTHLLVDRCLGPNELQWMVLMFQKEVAQRLMAKPRTKDYGFLSVMAQLHFRMTRVLDAAPGDFFPAPKIASRVLLFERLPDPELGVGFLKFVKQAFAFRRKYLLKNLKGAVAKDKLDELPAVAAGIGLKPTARAEELPPAQFVELYRQLRHLPGPRPQ